jgi:hypothetical protein
MANIYVGHTSYGIQYSGEIKCSGLGSVTHNTDSKWGGQN